MEESLTERLHKLAAEAHEAFPDALKNFVVINKNTLVYASPEIVSHLTKNIAAVKFIIQQTAEYFDNQKTSKAFTVSYPLYEKNIKLLAINTKGTNLNDTSSQFIKEKARFNHEIGHIVTESGLSSGTISKDNLAEGASDAYGAFQYIQQNDKKADFFERYNRADCIVLGISPIHYTNDVTQRVKQLSEEMDISSLSLNEMAEFAEKIALENHLDDKTLEKIITAFSSTANAYEKAGKKWNNNVTSNLNKFEIFGCDSFKINTFNQLKILDINGVIKLQ